jgi:probable HAF family extracellular repeat protein
MKSRTLACIAAVTVFAVPKIQLRLVAQNNQVDKEGQKHHHYKLIDIGTFGGPSSYFDDLALSDRFGFLPFIFEIAPVLNKQGVLAGWADTSMPDPNPAFCFNPDCFVSHAFRWRNGVKTDLGVLPGGASSAALWINSKGLIVGMSQNGVIDPLTGIPEVRGVVWKKGQIADLGTFGGNVSYASAVNNQGQVVGTALNEIPDQFSFYDLLFTLPGSLNGTQTRAFLWDEEHGMQDLGTLGGFDATANLVNQSGQVTGFSYTNSTPNPTTGIPTFHPFLWDKEKGMRDLGSLGGTALGSVNALNERGQVVGATTIAGDAQLHPFLWDGAELIDLIAPPFGGSANGEAAWINEAGEVVGLAGIPLPCPGSPNQSQVQHAFLWRKGVMMDLGTIAGTLNSEADFINSKSQIVGHSFACDFSVFDAILWENGSMVDLNTLIPHDSPFHLYSTSFVDDRGVIAAFGSLANGDRHALLLIPCDEDHGDSECEDEGEGTGVVRGETNQELNVLPENVRKLLRQRMARRYHIRGFRASPRD